MNDQPRQILGRTSDYKGLVALLAARRRSLGWSQEAVNEIAGLQGGYLNKIEAGIRGLGSMSLSVLLPTLGVELALVTASKTPPSVSENANLSSASERSPLEEYKKVRQAIAAKGGRARAWKLSPRKRQAIARQGGQAAAAKARKRRLELAAVKPRKPRRKAAP